VKNLTNQRERPWRGSSGNGGVPADAIVSHPGSLITATDASKAREALEERGMQRVLLVTSATHMRRALAVFRKAGIDAVPAPTDHEEMECPKPPAGRRVVFVYLPNADALARSTKAVNEYVGMVWYRLRSWA